MLNLIFDTLAILGTLVSAASFLKSAFTRDDRFDDEQRSTFRS